MRREKTVQDHVYLCTFLCLYIRIPQIHSVGLCNLVSSFAVRIIAFILLESKWTYGLTKKVYIFKNVF